MPVYLVAYDLVDEARSSFSYQPLWDELRRLDAHRVQYSLWLVTLSNTPREVADHFKQFMDRNDRVWVSTVRKSEYWFANAMSGTNKWLEQNPPRDYCESLFEVGKLIRELFLLNFRKPHLSIRVIFGNFPGPVLYIDPRCP